MPQTHAELIRCIFESLALKYKDILEKFRVLAPFPIEKLHIIGGGSKNRLLDQFTANAIGIPVVAGRRKRRPSATSCCRRAPQDVSVRCSRCAI